MMRAVFIHDHIFKTYNGKFYSEGKLTATTWQRYLMHIDELIIIARQTQISKNDINNYSLASCDRVFFNCINEISLLDRLLTSKIDEYLKLIIKNCDFVICRLPSFLGQRAFRVSKLLNKKILTEVVGCPYDSYKYHGSIIALLLAPLEKLKFKYILSKADYTVYVTKYFLQKRYPTSGKSIGISNVELLPFKLNDNFRERVTDESFKISFIGSLNAKYKGLSDLISAIAIMNKPIIELHILGSGDKYQYIKLAKKLGIENQLFFYEPIVGGNSILDWLSQFDLYIQPSHTEGLPRALIEAMSIGLPCIGSKVGGIPELLTKDSLFQPKDVIELSNKIKLFMNNLLFRQSQSELNLLTSQDYKFNVLSKKRAKFLKDFFGLKNYE